MFLKGTLYLDRCRDTEKERNRIDIFFVFKISETLFSKRKYNRVFNLNFSFLFEDDMWI